MAVGQVALANQLDWIKPDGWIDISDVANNEINILVGEGSMGFTITTSSGTYSIDWGDGTIETGRASGTAYGHTYAYGTGTATPYGYTVRKIRIYGASGNITRFVPASVPDQSGTSTQSRGLPMLWLALGTNNLTTAQYLCGVNNVNYPPQLQCVQLPPIISGITSWNQAFYQASSLQKVIGLDSAWGSVVDVANMFENCFSIRRIDLPTAAFPSSMTNMSGMFTGCSALTTLNMTNVWSANVTNYASLYAGCQALKSVILPTVWGTSAQLFNSMFASCFSLQTVTLPSAGFPNTTNNISNMFSNCYSLTKVDLGSSWGTTACNANSMFAACRNLQEIIFPSNMANFSSATTMLTGVAPSTALLQRVSNLDKLGSLTTQITFSTFCNSIFYTGGTISSLISSIAWAGGSATTKVGLNTLRLSNTGSLFAGTSPQVNVSYTQMETGSLQNLFTDIAATSVSGSVGTKTIAITGAAGTSGNTTNSMTYTSGSNIVNTTSGNTILPGYELSTAYSTVAPMNWLTNVVVSASTDTFTPATFNPLINGKVIYFTAQAVNNITLYKPYYVINATSTTFQISLTPGGSVFDITGNSGPGHTIGFAANVVSYSGTSITMDTVATASTSVSSTVSPLKRIDLLARGWTVTG